MTTQIAIFFPLELLEYSAALTLEISITVAFLTPNINPQSQTSEFSGLVNLHFGQSFELNG